MAGDTFTAPCGCTWHGRRHDETCTVWLTLVAGRERLRQAVNTEYGELRRIEEQMNEHMPPWAVEDDRP